MIFFQVLILATVSETLSVIFTKYPVCYDDLGCFPTGGDFYDIKLRPVNLPPQTPDKVNTKFLLFTKENPLRHQEISRYNPSTIEDSYFDPKNPIKFCIHGFRSNPFESGFLQIRNALLKDEDINFISVDWSSGARIPYTQATANTRVVGAEIAMLISYFHETYQISLSDVHIIGHSLGAHIAGYAGARLNGTIGRISGLDPAEPYFGSLPRSVRLDDSDAQFVDILHTDGLPIFLLGFGIYDAIGHVDFYPDGGEDVKSCDVPNLISNMAFNGLDVLMSDCSHGRAVDLYAASISNNQCPFTAHACSSFEDYLAAKCTSCGVDRSDCQRMGYYARPNPNSFHKSFYLTTGHRAPYYCIYHWLLRFTVKNIEKQQEVQGKIAVKIFGYSNVYNAFEVNPGRKTFKPGKSYKFIFTLPSDPEMVRSIDIQWIYEGNLIYGISSIFGAKEPRLYLEKVKLEPIDNMDPRLKQNEVTPLCSADFDHGLRHKHVAIASPKACKNVKN